MLPILQDEMLEAPHRVLLVEDDVLLRDLLAETMRDAGLTVIEAANADEAQRYLAAGGRCDLIFSDVQMPGSMDGIQFGRWIRQNYPEIPMILSSGVSAPEARDLGLFIPKPYGITKAAQIAREMVDSKRGDG